MACYGSPDRKASPRCSPWIRPGRAEVPNPPSCHLQRALSIAYVSHQEGTFSCNVNNLSSLCPSCWLVYWLRKSMRNHHPFVSRLYLQEQPSAWTSSTMGQITSSLWLRVATSQGNFGTYRKLPERVVRM